METAAARPAPPEVAREEILANVLRLLSSSAKVSPLLCRRRRAADDDEEGGGGEGGGIEGGNAADLRWDPLVSFEERDESAPDAVAPEADGGAAATRSEKRPRPFLLGWLRGRRSRDLRRRGTARDEDAARTTRAFAGAGGTRGPSNGVDAPGDDALWRAGLEALETNLFPDDGSSAAADDDSGGRRSGPEPSADPIPPHELLRVVMDSYYCGDDDLETGELAAVESIDADATRSERVYRLPSSVAVLFLRALLLSRALEGAAESISRSSESSQPVRWRRLKSMADDALSLFRRMVFDHVGKSIEEFECGRRPETSESHPVEPKLVMTAATWLYVRHVFPSCRDLLRKILENDAKSGGGRGTSSSTVKILETCRNSFAMLTSLLALEVAAVDSKRSAPSRCTQRVLECIASRGAGDFFDRARSARKKSPDEGDGGLGEEEEGMYRPRKDGGPGVGGARGTTLEEDLLLSPSIREGFENSDGPGGDTLYDELGIAAIAYWKLRAQADGAESSGLDPLPSPYSGAYRWTLLFPHACALLRGRRASSTVRRMDERGHMSMPDGYWVGVDRAIVSLGFDMLRTLLTRTPAIRPAGRSAKHLNPTLFRRAGSSRGLESAVVALLSHAMRLSGSEASRDSALHSESRTPLEYSSTDVMAVTRRLMGSYDPTTRVRALSNVCERIGRGPEGALLPTALDFARPIIVGMCRNVQRYADAKIALEDARAMNGISGILDGFLAEIEGAFGDPASPLPNDVEGFMSSAETYSSVFAILRLQRMWIGRCRAAIADGTVAGRATEALDGIATRMDGRLGALRSFDACLARFIDLLEGTEEEEEDEDWRPANWHRLHLTRLALTDALDE